MGLILFDATVNGVYSYQNVLQHHKEMEPEVKRPDGVVFACEFGYTEQLKKTLLFFKERVEELTAWINKSPYHIWQVLDKERYYYLCRIQLINLYLQK